MSYLEPTEFVTKMVESGESKVHMSTKDTLIRSFMAGAILALAAMFAITVATKTGSPLLGAILFPVGFIMLYLMKFDLLTGVFTLVPLALIDKRPGVTVGEVLRNWGLVFIGNFGGALAVALMMSFILTYGYNIDGGVLAEKVAKIGESRTLGYKAHGMDGWVTIFIRGMLCNWMVSMGVVGAMISTSATGKMMAMWMPIMLFFFMGFEHSIVNMFLFPFSMIMGGGFTISEYLIWNELPTVFGNLVGGFVLVGLPLYLTHVRTSPQRLVSDNSQLRKLTVSSISPSLTREVASGESFDHQWTPKPRRGLYYITPNSPNSYFTFIQMLQKTTMTLMDSVLMLAGPEFRKLMREELEWNPGEKPN